MRRVSAAGLLTPPPSPERLNSQSICETVVGKLVEVESSRNHPKDGCRSFSLAELTPPTTPNHQATAQRHVITSTAITQVDGINDIVSSLPIETSHHIHGKLTRLLSDATTVTPSGPRRSQFDLASPSHCPFPNPESEGLDTPTPLARALPAEGSFPFPRQGRRLGTLAPLTLRRSRPQCLPGQRAISYSLSRPRRFSGADRFIPARSLSTHIGESYRLAKPPEQLTYHERATRQRPPGSNPFITRTLRLPNAANRTSTHPATGSNSVPVNPRRGYRANVARRISSGGVWNIGAIVTAGDSSAAVHDGRGRLLGSGTNAPLYTARFLTNSDASRELDIYERRLALAFDVDQSNRVLGSPEELAPPSTPTNRSFGGSSSPASPVTHNSSSPLAWRDSNWVQPGTSSMLDAPALRDDFYCSLIAYSVSAKTLAVGLGSHVYLWSEGHGVDTPESLNIYSTSHVTSTSFSSTQGARAILAVGRADGRVVLWSALDAESRFNTKQQSPISCLAFRPNTMRRTSKRDPHVMVDTEDLLVGDEIGHVYYYAIEWPDTDTKELFDWQGSLTLLARVAVHEQQVCGLAWSNEGEFFATGGNDNLCALFETKKILGTQMQDSPRTEAQIDANGNQIWTVIPEMDPALTISSSRIKHQWTLNAAVKAIAFCPWQRGLLAIGGGSNDRCIHFYHTISGACLATIDCSAQVTSLIWSTTRREICATFGFAQPDHPYRIAVFAWPSCEQVVTIPWFDEHRALYAIAYPGGPSAGRRRREGGQWWQRTSDEGCVVVATSDASIKFHEVWSEERRATVGGVGLLGGSDILESLHGVDQRGNEAIR